MRKRQRATTYEARRRAFRISDILIWADAYHARHGTWPKYNSGPIPESPNDSWQKVHAALRNGLRGLSPGSSLAQLLAEHRGVRYQRNLPRLRGKVILKWADTFHARTGRWPTRRSGPIPEAPGENWNRVNFALAVGARGLPGGSTLTQFLSQHRGARNRTPPPHSPLLKS
jgi:hypothetical protein